MADNAEERRHQQRTTDDIIEQVEEVTDIIEDAAAQLREVVETYKRQRGESSGGKS